MESAEWIIVTLKNWKDYNPRKDVKRPSWFRFEHSLIEDSDFYDFTDAEFKAWIYVLSQASKKNAPTVRLRFEHADRACRVKKADLLSAIGKLVDLKILAKGGTITSQTRDGDDTALPATDGRTDETLRDGTGRDDTNVPPPTKEQIRSCIESWKGTLAAFKIPRELSQAEETQIARAAIRYGWKTVELALFGARFEPEVKDFKPSEHVSLNRILELDRDGKLKLDKFANFGSAARTKLAAEENRKKPAEEVPHSEMPEDIKELFAKFPKRDSELKEAAQ